MKVLFDFEYETKGAVRYQEIDADGNPLKIGKGASIGTLYIRKEALPTNFQRRLNVEINILENKEEWEKEIDEKLDEAN